MLAGCTRLQDTPRMAGKRHRKKPPGGATHGPSTAVPVLPVYRGGRGFRDEIDPSSNESILTAADAESPSPFVQRTK